METASSFPPSKIKTKSEKSPLTLSQASLMPLAHSFACGLGFQIMLFPHTSAKHADEWYADPEYQELSEHRRASVTTTLTRVSGLPPRT